MNRPHKTDLVILGGGCAGLSLASRLAQEGTLEVTVVEPRPTYLDDRTWCFWSDGRPSQDTNLVSHQWSQVSVSDGDKSVRVDCSARPYSLIRSIDFYAHHASIIDASANVTLLSGARAETPKQVGSHWETQMAGGVIESKFVVDTRPFLDKKGIEPMLWQSFLGVEIETVDDLFDADRAQLMNFLPSAGNEVKFLYILPFSARRALVEITYFCPHRPTQAEMWAALKAALPEKHTVLRQEQGAIPMGLPHAVTPSRTNYVFAGAHAGCTRASTGYAYKRIQKWAETCAASIHAGNPPLAVSQDPLWMRHMDRIFLQVLLNEPARAADIFGRLFRGVSPHELTRFLSDEAKAMDLLAVVAALPKMPFLRALRRSTGRVEDRSVCPT